MNRPQHIKTNRGFALVASLLLMILLVIVAVGLLSLSTISLRSTSAGQAMKAAEANARLAVMLALGELQVALGDDRRVTATASILDSGPAPRGRMVGVWDSATSNLRDAPFGSGSIPYDAWKKDKFKTWLISAGDPESTRKLDFAGAAVPAESIALFNTDDDGFDLQAGRVNIARSGATGSSSVAYAVVQEADKAHISLPGDSYQETNDVIQAPMHANLALSGFAMQPEGGWNERSAKLISLNQAELDKGYGIKKEAASALGADYTVWSRGVLADVANGGLKVDLNLAFELPDSDFAKSKWDGIANPFRSGGSEVPLHGQAGTGAPVYTTLDYGTVKNTQRFPVGSAPTFDMLRAYYRSYRHLYRSGGTTTAYERPQVNKVWSKSMASVYPAPRGSETSVAPVLDRMLYLLSLKADAMGTPWLVITPVITLWNPYNVAIESPGYVAYPWVDIPMWLEFTVKSGQTVKERSGTYLSWLIGSGKVKEGEGRQLDPYFYCNITADGTNGSVAPVRIEPGEIRIFVPVETTPRAYDRKAAASARVWNMMPVKDISQLKLGGGVGIDTTRGMSAGPASKMAVGDTLSCKFHFQPSIYHYFTTLEDSAKLGNPLAKGTVINEVQLYKGSENVTIDSTTYTHFPGAKAQLVGVLETYHRTAMQQGQEADIVQSVNTRQRYINSAVSGSGFLAGPHYHSNIRQGTTLAGLGLETSMDGRRAFYGATNGADQGRQQVVLFDIPRQPPLSLASLQNADLADTAFSPSNQFANSWASPHLSRDSVGRKVNTTATGERIYPGGLGIYDHSWLLNDALWDRYFFSSIAPRVQQRSGSGSPSVYNGSQVDEVRGIDATVDEWIDAPLENPLRNARHSFHQGGLQRSEIKDRLTGEAGAHHAAAHMLVDGAFNVNSTNTGAWRAILASLRGESFESLTASGGLKSHDPGDDTPVPRLSIPSGAPEDDWNGFRQLDDKQVERLAEEIVVEVKKRGPFQSIAEFVNRRIDDGDLGLKGALQAAIDRSGLNDDARLAKFETDKFYEPDNLPDPHTGTGLAGWLTQADLLAPMASIITVRSDTFRIRGYGEVKNPAGQVIARAGCEAVVQRLPEWVDPADAAIVHPGDLKSETNKLFGRRFEVVSFRTLSNKELPR